MYLRLATTVKREVPIVNIKNNNIFIHFEARGVDWGEGVGIRSPYWLFITLVKSFERVGDFPIFLFHLGMSFFLSTPFQKFCLRHCIL